MMVNKITHVVFDCVCGFDMFVVICCLFVCILFVVFVCGTQKMTRKTNKGSTKSTQTKRNRQNHDVAVCSRFFVFLLVSLFVCVVCCLFVL